MTSDKSWEVPNSSTSWRELHGKKAKVIYWPGEDEKEVRPGENEELIFIYEYCGEFSTHWFSFQRDGKEISRYNARELADIVWAGEEK